MPCASTCAGDPSFAWPAGPGPGHRRRPRAHQALPWGRGCVESPGLDPGQPLVDVVFQRVNVEPGALDLPSARVKQFTGERAYAPLAPRGAPGRGPGRRPHRTRRPPRHAALDPQHRGRPAGRHPPRCSGPHSPIPACPSPHCTRTGPAGGPPADRCR
ncbi:hypothetical protein LT493_00500 [Streptomyces tricolor]|nr:hypothetical protein [Streptomyces tricolor]